jgi:hypothetical protein
MYWTPAETRKARTEHRCTWCGQKILQGEKYLRWASYDGGYCDTNKMHPECHEAACDGLSDFEYVLYEGERPEKPSNKTEAEQK